MWRELRLRLLGLRLLVPEPVDEALQPRDVGLVALDRLRRVSARAAFSRRQSMPLPRRSRSSGPPRARARRSSVASRNQRSCATRIDGGVEPDERPLEPLEPLDVEVVRRLVEEQQVGVAGQRACERGARQLAAGERVEPPVELVVGEAEAAQRRERALAPRVAAGVLERAPAPPSSGAASPARGRPRPSPAPAGAAPARARRGRARRAGRISRSGDEAPAAAERRSRWSCSATRVPFSNTSCPASTPVSPASIRSSVVLPAPFGPESESRSRRSTLNETPSKSSPPESSLRRLVPMTTAMPPYRLVLGRRCSRPGRACAPPPRSPSRRSRTRPGARPACPSRGISLTARRRTCAWASRSASADEHRLAEAAFGPVVLDGDDPAGLLRRRCERRLRRSA